MKSVGILVGEKGNWSFFHDIYADLQQHYRTVVYQPKTYRTPLLYGRLNRWAFTRGIRNVLKTADVAFFEWASELLVPASHMPKICPIVVRLHSYEIYAWAPQVNWDHVDRVILVSRAMRRTFADLYPAHAHKSTVVYNARPLEQFRPQPRAFGLDLGMLAAFNPRKRIYEVVMMLRDLRGQGYDAHLHLAGARLHAPDFDEYYVAIQRLVEKLALQPYVHFYDHVTDTAAWLRDIDIFISNSYWEGHQVALVEAMAAGCYCLSHCWDGAEEMLPAENLYVSETELMAKIIAYSALSAEERAGRQGQMRALACTQFDLAQQTARIRAIIDEVAGD